MEAQKQLGSGFKIRNFEIPDELKLTEEEIYYFDNTLGYLMRFPVTSITSNELQHIKEVNSSNCGT